MTACLGVLLLSHACVCRAGNPPQVAAVPDWTPYLPTVPEPEFPSGHSVLSGTAAAVLAS